MLVSPSFLYRLEKAADGPKPAPVYDWELASRLELLPAVVGAPTPPLREAAAAGRLRDPDVLAAQARRLLKAPEARRLATEFACQWLDVYGFDALDEKSERHFPTFNALRGAMYEETIRFFTDLFQSDASVLSIFDADHAFLNEALAKHYGIPGVSGPEWRRVEGVRKFGRGGILGLSATLSKHSGASRTSPILRGNWVTESLLGEGTPKPPPGVPILPDEDASAGGLSVRQIVEKHTSDVRCMGCHSRIDPFGFALEAYDAIGRFREKDGSGQPVDAHAKLRDGGRVRRLRRTSTLPVGHPARHGGPSVLQEAARLRARPRGVSSPTSRCWTRCVRNSKRTIIASRPPSRRSFAVVSSARSGATPRPSRRIVDFHSNGFRFHQPFFVARRPMRNSRAYPGARFSEASASRWRCPGSNRATSGAPSALDPPGRPRRPCGSACCSPATASTARSGGRKGEGKSMELGQVLAPLHDFREKMLFIRGLYNEEALKGNIHSSQTGNLLSGAPLASGGEIRSGTSFDQLLAQSHGGATKVPSLVLGCEKSNPSVHKNYSMLYSSHISWTSPTSPTPLELYPSLAFDRLFKDEVLKGDQSVLDAVLDDAATSAGASAWPTSASSTSISTRSARSSSGSTAPASGASCKAGGRRSTSRTCRVPPTAFRRTSPSTCG